MKKIILSALILSFVAGCGGHERDLSKLTPAQLAKLEKDRNDLNEENQKSIDKAVYIGKTPFGEDIYASEVWYSCPTCNPLYDKDKHTVYFVGNVVTKNYEVRSGKQTIDKVEVFLKADPTPEEVIKEAERLKKEIDMKNELEFKEYKRLKEKFENNN